MEISAPKTTSINTSLSPANNSTSGIATSTLTSFGTSLDNQSLITPAQNQLNIESAADQIASQLNQGNTQAAIEMLDNAQQGQPSIVNESLERMVAAKADTALATTQLSYMHATQQTFMNANQLDSLGRLQRAGTDIPRKPATSELSTLQEHQKFDVYASMVMTRGNQASVDALEDNQRVVLGMRTETNTTANDGQGEFDDRIVVLRKGADGSKHVDVFNTSSTEPSAQYDYRAGHDGRGNVTARAPDAIYANVTEKYRGNNRNVQGIDVNADNIPDMGRMAQGSYEMVATTHPNPGSVNDFALRPSPDQLSATNAANGVERDTNGDGEFNSDDINGVQDLNRTFKIHASSRNNTDSAGCQTIHRDDYQNFIEAITGVENPLDTATPPLQQTWQYVLTNVN